MTASQWRLILAVEVGITLLSRSPAAGAMGGRAGSSPPSGQVDNPGEETLLPATAAELTKLDAAFEVVISGGAVVGASVPFIMLDSTAVEFVFRAFVSHSRASEQWRSALGERANGRTGERAGVGLLTGPTGGDRKRLM